MEGGKDLPLCGNSNEIRLYHYILNLHCIPDEKRFEGSITIFLRSPSPGQTGKVFSVRDCVIFDSGNQSKGLSQTDTLNNKEPWKLKLDYHQLQVKKVTELLPSDSAIRKLNTGSTHLLEQMKDCFLECSSSNVESRLDYSMDDWCLKIWKKTACLPRDFPNVIKIYYSTKPESKSLRWCKDQDGK